jgi:hypothetical protein
VIPRAQQFTRGDISALLLCANPRIDPHSAEQIVAVAKSAPHWDGLLELAAEHGLSAVFYRNIQANATDALPPALRQRLKDESLRNSFGNLAFTAELFQVLEALESHGVCATPYKGPVLAAQAYGDVAMRQFSDLDLMVPQTQIAAADDALRALGFRPLVPDLKAEDTRQIPGQYAYRRDSEPIVELHTERTLRYFPRRLSVDELCERRECVRLTGRDVLAFSPEDTLLLLSVHGSKHFWERLGWIADIAALATTSRPMNWRLTLERAQQWGVQRMVLLGAGLAAELFRTPLPGEVTELVRRDRVARRLIAGVCQSFFSRQHAELGVFSRFAFRVRMRGSVAQGVPYAIRLTTMPTELDRGGHARFLEPLYALRRPLRLVRTYGWRARTGP